MSDLSSQVLRTLIAADCPVCAFTFEVELLDAATQVWRWCPCCRVHIRFNEGGGEVHGAMEDIDSAMRELERTLGGLTR